MVTVAESILTFVATGIAWVLNSFSHVSEGGYATFPGLQITFPIIYYLFISTI